MRELEKRGLIQPIREAASRGVPLLGICLGMQLLLEQSEEFGLSEGLGIIAGRVVPIPSSTQSSAPLKSPHIGWSELIPSGQSSWEGTLLEGHRVGNAMYFVHSYMAMPADPTVQFADCIYGGHRVAATIQKGNVMGCQFHPEKSGKSGLAFLRRFIGG